MSQELARHIPFTRRQVYSMLRADGRLQGADAQRFESFCRLLESIYHFEFHSTLEECKELYRPFNPDLAESEAIETPKADDEAALRARLVDVLNNGNFERATDDHLARAMEEEGLLPISLDVHFEDFEYYEIYYLGESHGEAEVAGWLPFTRKKVDFDSFDRVVLVLKLKPQAHFDLRKGEKQPGVPGKIYLKYLTGVPKADLEMIFPNTKPRMKLIHKLQIGAGLAIGIGITLWKLVLAPFVFKLEKNPFEHGISLAMAAILLGLGGYIFRTYTNYKSTVHQFLAKISSSLYFKNLVSNQGVFASLIDDAEEEETKEALLAYAFLLRGPAEGLDAETLDRQVEEWFVREHGTSLDFEVDDALRKLAELELATRDDEGRWTVLELEAALERLDYIWDNYFQFNTNASVDQPGATSA